MFIFHFALLAAASITSHASCPLECQASCGCKPECIACRFCHPDFQGSHGGMASDCIDSSIEATVSSDSQSLTWSSWENLLTHEPGPKHDYCTLQCFEVWAAAAPDFQNYTAYAVEGCSWPLPPPSAGLRYFKVRANTGMYVYHEYSHNAWSGVMQNPALSFLALSTSSEKKKSESRTLGRLHWSNVVQV